MKIANEKILQCVEVLNQCNSVTGFPGMIIAIVRRKMTEEIAEYVKERQKIAEKYGKKTDGGWIVPNDSPDFEKAMNEMLQISSFEVEIEFPQFSENEFIEKFQNDSLTAGCYDVLYELLVRKGV